MSSGAAIRARQLLAANESDSIESIKERIRTPVNLPSSKHAKGNAKGSRSRRRPSQGELGGQQEPQAQESSSRRAQEILDSMKQRRETFTSVLQDSKSPGGSSIRSDNEATPKQTPTGRPPRFFHPSEKDEIVQKMKESLKGKKERVSNLAKADHSRQRILTRSPHTVDTATTEESTSSSHSCHGDDGLSRSQQPHSLHSQQGIQPGEKGKRPHHHNPTQGHPNLMKSGSRHFLPIGSNGSVTDQSSSKDTTTEEDQSSRLASLEGSQGSSSPQGDKKVSFDEKLCVIQEIIPPAVVHCRSFESTLPKDPSLLPTNSSLDRGEQIDEWETRRLQYSSLVNNREKRVSLMRKLERTYKELLSLHEQVENEKQATAASAPPEDESDFSDNVSDDDSSCDFTNDTNTSGWISQDETNSRLDSSLLQYMTSEDDESNADTLTSFGRFSFTLSKSFSNLDTLPEHDGGEDVEAEMGDALTSASVVELANGTENTEDKRKEPVLPSSPLSLASTIIGSDVLETSYDSAVTHISLDKRQKSTKGPQKTAARDAPPNVHSIEAYYHSLESPPRRKRSTPSNSVEQEYSPQDPKASETYRERSGCEVAPQVRESKSPLRRDPSEDAVTDDVDEDSPTKVSRDPSCDAEELPVKMSRDPSCDSQDSNEKVVARDPSFDAQDATEQMVARDPSSDAQDDSTEEIVRDPSSCDTLDAPKDGPADANVDEKHATNRIPEPSSKENHDGGGGSDDDDDSESDGGFQAVIRAIQARGAKSKGLVQRQIDRWESAQVPKRPDPPMQKVNASKCLFESTPDTACLVDVHAKPEDVSAETSDHDEQVTCGVPSVVEVYTDSPQANVFPSTTGSPAVARMDVMEGVVARKKIRRYLFVPRQVSNKQCKALGGLFDLAQKTGISSSGPIYLTSRYIPRPPSIIAINSEFNCGTQGSLYDLSLRSGCVIDPLPEPRRLLLPCGRGGKRRWVLKTRGGHHHISIWTTLGNAA